MNMQVAEPPLYWCHLVIHSLVYILQAHLKVSSLCMRHLQINETHPSSPGAQSKVKQRSTPPHGKGTADTCQKQWCAAL